MEAVRMTVRCYCRLALIWLLLIRARGQILDKSQFEEGSQFTVTCDAAVVKLDNVFTKIQKVTLSQHNGIETRDIGELFSGTLFEDPTGSVNENIGPNWFIATPTTDEIKTAVQNRNIRTVMKIVAKNLKAKCSDGQMYKCVVQYYNEQNDLQDAVVQENMTAMAGANLVDMIPDPDNSRFGSRVSDYSDNETLTMKCTAKGPEDYAFQWRRKCPSKFNVQPYFVVWPVQNDTQTTVKTLSLDSNGQPNDCNLYLHRQDLKFQTELVLNDCIIECQFGIASTFSSSFMEKDSMNFTIQVSPDRGQILDKIQFEEGFQFTLKCDAAAVQLDKVFTKIQKVTLSQHNGIETRDIGVLFSGTLFEDSTVNVNENIGPNWFIATPTIDEIKTALQNRNTRTVMKIVASNTKAKRSDGQMFKCVVQYYDEQNNIQDAVVEENMTAMASTRESVNTAAIVGGIMAALAVIAIIVVIVWIVRRKGFRLPRPSTTLD